LERRAQGGGSTGGVRLSITISRDRLADPRKRAGPCRHDFITPGYMLYIRSLLLCILGAFGQKMFHN